MSDNVNFDLGRLVTALDEDLQSQLDYLAIVPDAHTRVQQFLVSDLQSVRFNILADMISISDLWSPIREQSYVVDLLLELTTSLRLHAECMQNGGWESLCSLMVQSIGCFNHQKIQAADCVLDNDDERDRYADPADFGKYVASNPWLVTLFMLRRTPSVRKMIREISHQAQRPGKPAGQ